MSWWKRCGILTLVIALVVGIVQEYRVFADSSRVGTPPTIQTGTFQTDAVSSAGGTTTVISGLGKNNALFGFSVHPVNANAYCGLYDATAKNGTTFTAQVFIDEGGAATQFNTFQSNWPAPYRLLNGLVVVDNAGTCIVYHEPVTFPS